MLGERLKQLREKKKLTQQEMANLLGIARGTYAHYEINSREPDNATLGRLADFFGVTTDELLGRQKNTQVDKEISQEELTKLFESLSPEEQKAFLIKHIIPILGDDHRSK
ncbi:helix-turn-helix domain-containing protein [Sporomusa termitida]|uniref:HTH-type transcriptional regulator Xre n=1 Tax=Sporomusa termitida TaxID=2377 RepID=A0A517DSJ4_9FIRM|nr:helix-turn-helix transcriptional regulator [Sporomusa termitida]QDR80307.1 HTH-type transcriptional regulator Xre [Sporomusa termitida]